MRCGRPVLEYALWACLGLAAILAGTALLHACAARIAILGIPFAVNFCPQSPPALSHLAQETERLTREQSHIEADLARRQLACAAIPLRPPPALDLPKAAGGPRPQQTAALRPPPPVAQRAPPPTPAAQVSPPKVDLDAERWKNKDLSLLEGCWRLGQDVSQSLYTPDGTTVVESNCTQRAGRLCFDTSGYGSNEESGFCPSGRTYNCRAPMTARFADDDSLVAEQPTGGACESGSPHYGRVLTCRRIDETRATCTRLYWNGGIDQVEFRR